MASTKHTAHTRWKTLIILLIGLLVFSVFAYLGLNKLLKEELPWQVIFILVLFGGLSGWAALWILFVVTVRYEWDDEYLIRKALLGARSIAWADIVSYQVRRWGADYTYFFYNARSERLKVDFQLIGWDSPLHSAIKQKLAHLFAASAAEIHPEMSPAFTERGLGLRKRTIRLTMEGVTAESRFKTQSIRYDEVRFVFREIYGTDLEMVREEYIISDGRGDQIEIDSHIPDFDRVIQYLRTRLESAVWVDLSQGPPSDPRAAMAFHRRRLSVIREKIRQDTITIIIFAAGMIFIYLKVLPIKSMVMLEIIFLISEGIIFLSLLGCRKIAEFHEVSIKRLEGIVQEDL